MPSLHAIAPAHAPLLLLDASSARIQAGIFGADGTGRWASSEEEAGVGLFRAVAALDIDLNQIRGFAFAASPGSILGIRIAAMALRTWCAIEPRPVFAYHGLALVAEALARPELTVIADARRGEWHCARIGRPPWRQPAGDWAGPTATPAEFRHWAELPEGTENITYRLEDLLPRAAEAVLFQLAAEPDALLVQAPAYATWSPHIHRAP